MANLGQLTLDLVAKIGGFTGPSDKASRHSKCARTGSDPRNCSAHGVKPSAVHPTVTMPA